MLYFKCFKSLKKECYLGMHKSELGIVGTSYVDKLLLPFERNVNISGLTVIENK